MWNQPHFWVLLVFVGLSFLQWLIRKLAEQSAINRKKQDAAKRQDEILRTGRDPDMAARAEARPGVARQAQVSTEAAARQARLRELRQRQLEELRKRNQRGKATPSPTTAARVPQQTRTAPPVRGRGAPSGPTIGAPRPSAQQRTPTPQRTPVQQRDSMRPGQGAKPRHAAPQTTPRAQTGAGSAPDIVRRARPSGAEGGMRDTTTPQSLASTPLLPIETKSGGAVTTVLGSRLTAADWRRAIVLGELLGPPLSLREPL